MDNAADDHRMFKVLPNYKTINDPEQPVVAMTPGQKFGLVEHYFDPFTFVFTSDGLCKTLRRRFHRWIHQ